MYATVAILGALQERNRSGLGQYLDIALLDSQIAMLANQNLNYMTSGKAPKRYGNAHKNITPYQAFKVEDGHIIIDVGNDGQLRRHCQVLGFDEFAFTYICQSNDMRLAYR